MYRKWLLSIAFIACMAPPSPLRAAPPPPTGGSYAYPNPGRGCCIHFVFLMEEKGKAEVRIYQESGDLASTTQDLKDTGQGELWVPLWNLAPGYYLYSITLKYDSGRTARLPAGRFTVANR